MSKASTSKEAQSKLNKRFNTAERWRSEGKKLREILLECDLSEELKWGKPCYTYEGKNIAIIQRMKGFLALMFFKGALLKDTKGLLKEQGENTVGPRRMQFESVDEVAALEKPIKAFVRQAIQVNKAGRTVPKAKPREYVAELAERLANDRAFRVAFDALTPGRRREYNLYFSSAKQSKTRISRIDKYASKILSKKGFRD